MISSLPQEEDSPTWRKNPPSESRFGYHEDSNLVILLEKLEISVTPEFMKRIDDVVELLSFNSREKLIQCAIQRFIDKYPTPEPRAC